MILEQYETPFMGSLNIFWALMLLDTIWKANEAFLHTVFPLSIVYMLREVLSTTTSYILVTELQNNAI